MGTGSLLFDHQEYNFEMFKDNVLEAGPAAFGIVPPFAVIDHVLVRLVAAPAFIVASFAALCYREESGSPGTVRCVARNDSGLIRYSEFFETQ